MTDLEMTKLCAEAMGIACEVNTDSHGSEFVEIIQARNPGNGGEYDPLHDDAQAMALVKRFLLILEPDDSCPECSYWAATYINHSKEKGTKSVAVRKAIDLNSAIVECIAKMKAR